MAIVRWTDLAIGLSILFLAALVGCAQPPIASKPMVATLPPPSFDGPNIVNKPAVAARPLGTGAAEGPLAWAPKTAARPWKWIVIHHSASPAGSMNVFDKEHKAKGWDGVGYHFVIGNGTNSADGQVEVTPRWPVQKWGAHAKTLDNRFNEYGIGICMVGNFDSARPTAAQMRSLTKLTAYLMQTYHIAPQNVVGHRDTKPTDCPGRYVNVAAIRQSAAQVMSTTGRPAAQTLQSETGSPRTAAASTELLGDLTRR
jgi:hypothetical protein